VKLKKGEFMGGRRVFSQPDGFGLAQRGFHRSNVSKETRTSKQLDAFLKLKSPRCAKPLLVEVAFTLYSNFMK
jgi:hypothetical protein